ncbi:hypothetical protein [Hyphomicrobium facile]|uniref:MxaH protein n=1 Tax=Hyphomicrobium facile TaxID=51670 RepID=A0A1I7NH93_9HYPH|nr:hypothetical protein [Hyphomicrobium facile]SFV34031.1 hypothetical protein SAMN04488557_2192 [Hyphomicrobium facile]
MNSQSSFLRIACFVTAALLSACSEEQQRQEGGEKRSGIVKADEAGWLARQDEIQPVDWLIARQGKSGAKLASEEAHRLRNSLAEASKRFKDSPRMIANRAVQLEQMIKEQGGDETAVMLIAELTRAIAPGHIESFGAAAHQYYNMRKAGFTSERAFDELSKRYGEGG